MARLNEPRRLMVANVLCILALGLLNGGAAALNMQLDHALPILRSCFLLGPRLTGVLDVLRQQTAPRAGCPKKAALFAAMPWWVLSLPALIAAIVSLLTADDAMKAVGWGLLTALPSWPAPYAGAFTS